jgi:hypothetical protein
VTVPTSETGNRILRDIDRHGTARRGRLRPLALALCLALGAAASFAPARADAAVRSWEHTGTVYAVRDIRDLRPTHDVVDGRVSDLAALLREFGLGDRARRAPGTFRVNAAKSHHGGWIVLNQYLGDIPLHRGRIALHADEAGTVDYLEWDAVEGAIVGAHGVAPSERNFLAALGTDGAELVNLWALTAAYQAHDGVVRPVWIARIRWESPRTGTHFDRVVLDAGGRLVSRTPLTAQHDGEVVDFEFGVPERIDLDPWLTFTKDRTVVRLGERILSEIGNSRLPLNSNDGGVHAPRWTEDRIDTAIAVSRHEHDPPTGEAAVDFAFDALGEIYDGLVDLYDWHSLNDWGGPILAILGNPNQTNHASSFVPLNLITLDNHGSNPHSMKKDVIAHEFVHGVVYNSTQFDRAFTPGTRRSESQAINESYADIFAAVLDARTQSLGQPSDRTGASTWDIGGIRRLDDPQASTAPGIDHYSALLDCSPQQEDANSCPDHRNSGVGSLAFHLFAQGGVHPRRRDGLRIEGIGWRRAAEVFFEVLKGRIGHAGETYADLRSHTTQVLAADPRFGPQSNELANLCKAWDTVGVPGTGQNLCAIVPARVSQVDVESGTCPGDNFLSWPAVSGATHYVAVSASSQGGYDGAPQIHSDPSRHLVYHLSGNAGTRYVYVKACNAITCGPFSSSFAAAVGSNRTCE